MTAAWTAAVVTFLAVVVALLKEELQALWRKPELTLHVRLAPPDCHKTELTVFNQQTGAVIDRWPCYYFRVWVENTGNVRAKQVQVFASRLLRKQADGTFKEEPQFLPMNFKWSHTGEVFTKGISPKMGKHCDIGHLVHPTHVANAGHTIASVPGGKTVVCLDLEVTPNTRTHLVGPGIYRIELRIAAANVKPVVKTIELTQTGDWSDDEAKMFSDGVGFRAVL